MANLAESGRSKLDVEISYSSSNQPTCLSTAEFVPCKQENPHEQQQHHQYQQRCRTQKSPPQLPTAQPPLGQPQQGRQELDHQTKASNSVCSQAGWSTKLRSVPLSIDFDVSVFATRDRHGRIILQPVLRTSDSVATAAASASSVPQVTGASRSVAQSLAFRGAGPSGGNQETDGDLGRNNCAKASILVHCPPLGLVSNRTNRPDKQQSQPNQVQTMMAETDISTETRGSFSGTNADNFAFSSAGMAATANPAAAAIARVSGNFEAVAQGVSTSFEYPNTRHQHQQQQPQQHQKLQQRQNQQRCGMCIRQHEGSRSTVGLIGDDSCCSSPAASSPIMGNLPAETTGGANRCSEPRLQSHARLRDRRQPQPCNEDGLSARSGFAASVSSRSESKASQPGHSISRRFLVQCNRYSALVRVVHKLETLLDAINPVEWKANDTASAPSRAATLARGHWRAGSTAAGSSPAGTPAALSRVRQSRELRSNLDVADLRHEYAMLFRS